ncbi:helix-turn-helix transcriptional regulator [Leisingera daeponensis]|uniref:helix-turn-helix transcriptional regulator n=1 Tax=Leisingera daeponensis TaxID=405746 RepID=UPI001C94A31D|nr:LuxR C-terminal-related transcriptional regulator [Leisingera daeponensis]MBY6057729.1 LuxR C-terminal-related transcriptional regulator [Leisingera daeponensis]
MKNALIDTLDTLLHPQDPGGRWLAAQQLAREMGVKSILVAQISGPSKHIGWISTDMPAAWMEEYLGEGYMAVDPFLNGLADKPGSMQLDSGVLRRSEAGSKQAWALNHGLKDAGFGGLICSRYGAAGGPGKLVTLAFDCPAETARAAAPLEVQLFSALLASTLGQDDPPAAERYSSPGRPLLTARQQQVLSLLAQGMMTARIAETLGLSEAAVSLHFANARKALGASTREHALALALKQGLISL